MSDCCSAEHPHHDMPPADGETHWLARRARRLQSGVVVFDPPFCPTSPTGHPSGCRCR